MSKHSNCDCKQDAHRIYRDMSHIVEFMKRDPDNRVFQKFDTLELYNCLFLRHELAHIASRVFKVETSLRGEDDMKELGAMLPGLDNLLQKYSQAVQRLEAVSNRPGVPAYIQRVLRKLGAENDDYSFQSEFDIGNGWQDMAPLVVKDKGVIHTFVDNTPPLSEQFAKWANSNPNSNIYQYSEHAVRLVEQIIVNTIVLAFIGVPVYLLAHVTSVPGKFWITVGFVGMAIPVLSKLVSAADKNQIALVFSTIDRFYKSELITALTTLHLKE